MKHAKLIAATVAALSLLSLYLFTFSGPISSIPWIHIGEEQVPDPNQPPQAKAITGNLRYDLILNYKDGTKDTFSDTFQLPTVPLGSVSNSQNKEIDNIEVAAIASLSVPANSGHTIGNAFYSESTVTVSAGANQIATKGFNTVRNTADVSTPYELYRLTIPASSIKIATGTYDIKVSSKDDIRVAVDGTDKHMILEATPQLKVASTGVAITPISVVTYTPAGVVNLTNDPIYYYYSCATVQEPAKMCPQQTSNKWYVTIKATGFKANAPATFTYAEHSYFKTAQQMPIYPAAPKVITTDSQGSASDKYNVYNGYSTPECEYYGGTVNISDGLNSVGPLQIGCNYRYG